MWNSSIQRPVPPLIFIVASASWRVSTSWLLAASRRKGDYAPRFSLAFLGNPVVLAAIW